MSSITVKAPPPDPPTNTDLEPCPRRPSQLLTDATSNLSTSACSKTSATGSSVTISSVPAPAPSAQNLSAIGTFRPTYHHPASLFLRIPAQSNVHDPRALAVILERAEEELARKRHPDPYIRAFLKTFLTPYASAHIYDYTYLRQIQLSLAVQSGASIVSQASWGILFVHLFCFCSCFRWTGNV